MALRVPITAGPETTITIVFKTPIFGADLTTVRNAHLTVTRRDGSVVTWALTIISATPSELVTQYEFQGPNPGNELSTTGAYLLAPHFVTNASNDILGQTIALFVTADAGFSAQIETSGWIAVTSPIATLGQVSGSWKRIAPSDSPYQATPLSPWLAVDLSSGSVSTTLWSGSDGDVVLFSDYLDGAGVGGHKLTLIGKGAQRLPVGDGTYSSSVNYTGTGFQLGLKYSAPLSEWLPWIRDARSATASSGGGGTSFTPVLPLRLASGLLSIDPASSASTGSFSSQDKTILGGLPDLISTAQSTASAAFALALLAEADAQTAILAAANALSVANSKVASVSGTAGQISFTGTTNPIGSLVPTGVAAGTYPRATVTVDLLGRVTSASTGTSSESASGADGSVQFAKAGDFASDSNLFWDDSLKLLGIGTATPETRLHVVAADGLIKPPTAASATLVVEPVLNSPTITSVTAIIGPDDPSSSGGTVNNDYPNPTPWTASGSDWGIIVYATLTVDGVQYTSPVGTTSDMGFDNGDSGFLSFSTSWAASSFGDGYKVVLTQNGSPVFYADVSGPVTTSYTFDENSVAAGGPNAFISFAYPYDPGITPPSPIASTFGASPQYGSGPYLADGNSYSYTIDGATFDPTTGLYYASGSPTGAGNFTDDGSFNQFFVEIDFTPPIGSNDNSIVQGQINGGSFFYFFGGNSGIANDFSGGVNDPTAEAAWLRTYPGNVGFSHNYDATGYATSPATYYATTPNTGSFGAINPATGYMLQLGLSWGSTTNAKLRGSSTGTTTTGITVNSTQTTLIDRPAIWGGSPTITPNHVGFVSGGQTETFHFYGRATSPSTYFSQSVTTATAVFPNDSVYRYINLAWTNDASATSAKILRDQGGGFNTGYQGGFGQVFQTYTSSSPSWSDGTTITPNSIPGTAGLFEGATTTLSDSPQIVVRSTLSAAARIAFQNSSHVQTGTIGIDPANLTMRFISPAAIWEFGTSASQNLISLQTQSATFNLTNLSGYRFAINGFSEALFTVASSSHSVAIGAASNIGGGALVVEPVVNIPNIYLKLFGGGGANANFITGVKADNTAGFAVTHDGHISINGASDLAFLNIPAGTTTYGGIYITPGTLVSAPSSGLIEHDNSSFYVTQTGGRFRVAVGPVGGLTYQSMPIIDGNGNLVDSGLQSYNSGGDFRVTGYNSWEFKQSVALDAGKNLTVNTGGLLTSPSLIVSGTAGAGFVNYPTQSSNPATGTNGFRLFADSTGRFSWKVQADGFVRSFIGAITASRTYTLPDASTTVVGTDTTQTLTNKTMSGASNTFTNIPNSALSTTYLQAANNLSDVTSSTTARGNLSAAKSGANTDINSIVLQGTAGAGFIAFPTQSSAPSNPASGVAVYADSTGRFSWKRQSDGFTRTFDAALTANRVYTLPDATTTLVGTDTTATLTNKTIDGGSNTLTNIANGSLSGAPTSSNTASTIALRDASGNFTMGALTASTLISSASNPATTGAIRLATGDIVKIRNAGNTSDQVLLSFDGRVAFGAANQLTAMIGGTGYLDVTDMYFRHQNTTEYIHFTNGNIQFSQNIACKLYIVDKAGTSATGSALTLKGQSCTGTTSNGGDINIGGGDGTSNNGAINLANTVTTTTAPAAGAAGALPVFPTGYATLKVNGTARQFAYY